MRNRYGVEYSFELVDHNTYILVGKFDPYGRFGVNPDDNTQLTFVDPSGGPYIAVGNKIYNKLITQIFLKNEQIYFKVE